MSRYDIEKFDPPPDPDLVCCICQCVLDQAVECPCRHVFCQACIERWLTNRHTCPTCRTRTRKQDLRPVLPLVQNMLNRLMMICEFRDNGCFEKIMLEHFERHIKNCGYEMKNCRFTKCQMPVLKMNLDDHETNQCDHRESMCDGECGLMIALSDKSNHNCVAALKENIEEKNIMIEILKAKLQELNNLSQSLNDQLEQLRQQLNERPPRLFDSITDTSSDDDDDFLSGESDDSFPDTLSEPSGDGLLDPVIPIPVAPGSPTRQPVPANNNNNNTTNGNNNIAGGAGNDFGADVVEQVERTVVSSLFELSSRLERVRNQMRAVLNSGLVQEQNNLNDEIRIPAIALVNVDPNTNGTSEQPRNNENNHNSNAPPNADVANNNAEAINDLADNQLLSQADAHSNVGSHIPSSPDDSNNSHYQSSPIQSRRPSSSDSLSDLDSSPSRSNPRSSQWYRQHSRYSSDYNSANHTDTNSDNGDNRHVVLTLPPASPTTSSDAASSDVESTALSSSIPTITSPVSSRSASSTPQMSPRSVRSPVSSPASSPLWRRRSSREQRRCFTTSSPISISSWSSINSNDIHSDNENEHENSNVRRETRSPVGNNLLDNVTDFSAVSPAESAISSAHSSQGDTSVDGSHKGNSSPNQQRYNDMHSGSSQSGENDSSFDPLGCSSSEDDTLGESLVGKDSTLMKEGDNDQNHSTLREESDSEGSVDPLGMSLTEDFETSLEDNGRHSPADDFNTDDKNSHRKPFENMFSHLLEPPTNDTCAKRSSSGASPSARTKKSSESGACSNTGSLPTLENLDHSRSLSSSSRKTYPDLGPSYSGKLASYKSQYDSDNKQLRSPSAAGSSNFSVEGSRTAVTQSGSVYRCEPDSTQGPASTQCHNRPSASGSNSDSPVTFNLTDSSDSDQSDSMKYLTKRLRRNYRKDHRRSSNHSQESVSSRNSALLDSGIGTETNSQTTNSSDSALSRKYELRKRKLEDSESLKDNKRTRSENNQRGPIAISNSTVSEKHNSYHGDNSKKRIAAKNSTSHKRTSTITSESMTQEQNGQSLNVKIDLSLINYSGPLGQESSGNSATLVHGSANISPYHSSPRSHHRQPFRSGASMTESSQSTSSLKQNSNHSSYRLQSRYPKRSATNASALEKTQTGSPAIPSSLWEDSEESNVSSDNTWEPGSDPETDVTITDGESYETDSNYEVQVPKSAATLLEEYGSDTSDESWTVDCADQC